MDGRDIKGPRIVFPRSNGKVDPNVYHREARVGFTFPGGVSNGGVRLVHGSKWIYVASRVGLQ